MRALSGPARLHISACLRGSRKLAISTDTHSRRIVPLVFASQPAQSPSPSHNRHANPPPPNNCHQDAAQKYDIHSTAAGCGKSSPPPASTAARFSIIAGRLTADVNHPSCPPSRNTFVLPSIRKCASTAMPVIIPFHHQQALIVRIRQLNQLARQLARRKMPVQFRALHARTSFDHHCAQSNRLPTRRPPDRLR